MNPELRRPVLWRFMVGVLSDWLVIFAAFALLAWTRHPLAWVTAVILIGPRQHAIGIMAHDAAHRLASRNKLANDVVAELLCFWPLTISVHGYRPFHLDHHRHLGTEADTELAYRRAGAPTWDMPTSRGALARMMVLDCFGRHALEIPRIHVHGGGPDWRTRVGPVAWAVAFITLSVSVGAWYAPVAYYTAFFTTFVAAWHFRCAIEHQGTAETHRVDMPRWLAWWVAPHETWMHWEHHRHIGVPYWRLADARREDTSEPVVPLAEVFRRLEASPPYRSGEMFPG
ncbi:MAG TPA: fatty acid desaturase [Myxococcota bacterium]|nr:fatty acid desaturase [Myxococcota bacterium]